MLSSLQVEAEAKLALVLVLDLAYEPVALFVSVVGFDLLWV